MHQTFLERVQAIPTTRNAADNVVTPKPDIAAARLGIACAELLIPPQLCPTITAAQEDQTSSGAKY
jgi:hypothetical protein